ncbi:MAG: polysaccharide biosynthesis/export family protein [Muribaculaceae bacterium]|nr:polysaccharide biosynthesis/export family protein [Muribaculaceae bacterium]
MLINKRLAQGLLIACFAAFMSSCQAPKKVAYLQNIDDLTAAQLDNTHPFKEPVFVPGDMLNIQVTGKYMNAAAAFNKGSYVDGQGEIKRYSQTNNLGSNSTSSTDFYLVDSQGDIEFPILGTIHVAGMNKQQLRDYLISAIYPRYLTEAPTVEIRLMNFRVTVLGSIGRSSIIEANNEQMNIIEAIAKAGDLKLLGQRDNILLIRTNPDGKRITHRYNLNDANILLSPYFNLQQGDILYVEPNRSEKQGSWQMSSAFTTAVTVAGGISGIIGLVVSIINLSK